MINFFKKGNYWISGSLLLFLTLLFISGCAAMEKAPAFPLEAGSSSTPYDINTDTECAPSGPI